MLDDMAITTSWDANTMHSGNYYLLIFFFIIVFSVLVVLLSYIYYFLGLIEKKNQSFSFAAKKIHFQLFSYDEFKDLNKCKMTLRSHKNMHMQIV